MPLLELGPQDGLHYIHTTPKAEGAPTFVFVNALTGTTAHWEDIVAPSLREKGFGTLSYNFRGQTDSPFTPGTALTPDLIVEDIQSLVTTLKPERPVLVGLSIGGLFAAQAVRAGMAAAGLVLLNTLRQIGPRIRWINDALPVFAATTGVQMMMDATFPMLVNPDYLEKVRPGALTGEIAPLPETHPHFNLMSNSTKADWDFPWETMTLPVLNITGLCDRVFYDERIVNRMMSRIPDLRRLDWDDCGHLVPLERPNALARALTAFGTELS